MRTVRAVALCLLASVALADDDVQVRYLSAYDIGAACRDEQVRASAEICYAFILGVLQTRATLAPDANPRYCLPDGATRDALVHAIRRHIRRAPGALDTPADRFVVDALVSAFPCD